MNSFDKIIGYDAIKKDCDMIHNKDVYEKLGAKMPQGVLLYGDPGLGKSLMAKCFIAESGLKAFTVRKTTSEDFAGHITKVFAEAKEHAPCIIFLDDMDKFANEDANHRDAEEYVAVQSGIDDVKESDVFVLATVNEIYKLPDSLKRAGRFDRVIEVEIPCNEDAQKIVEHYLKTKKVSPDMNIDDIAKMINYSSCAELETIVNEAAIHAASERKPYIETCDFIYAVLRLEYNVPNDYAKASDETVKRVAFHEAGHAVMSEILLPGSVGLVSLCANGRSRSRGFVRRCKSFDSASQHILTSLAGKATAELYFGVCDLGSGDDIRKAYQCIRDGISEEGTHGLGMIDVADHRFPETSENMNARNEAVVQAEMERYMYQAREILIKNKAFLEKVAEELIKNQTLLNSDMQKIRTSVNVSEVVA